MKIPPYTCIRYGGIIVSKTRHYASFMDDQKLLDAVEKLYKAYEKAFASKSLKELNKNIIDPFKFQFDTAFIHEGKAEKTFNNEVFRQSDKSISNAIGLFHQQLLGSLDGFAESPELPCDVKNDSNTIFAEVKNKHNTMNVRSAAGVYDELASLAKSYPQAMCYLVEIIAKRSIDEIWSITINQTEQRHKRIHVISADKFYALATGKENALQELVAALPDAINDFLNRYEGHSAKKGKSPAYKELAEKTEGTDIVSQMYKIAFPDYTGFSR